MHEPPVVIAGCGAITAVGGDVDALRVALRANTSGLRPCARFDHPRYQPGLYGAASPTGDHDDPAYRLAAEALRQARIEAGNALTSIPPERISLVLSTT